MPTNSPPSTRRTRNVSPENAGHPYGKKTLVEKLCVMTGGYVERQDLHKEGCAELMRDLGPLFRAHDHADYHRTMGTLLHFYLNS